MLEHTVRISPNSSVQDWQDLNFGIKKGWERAIQIFDERIQGRFLKHVEKIAKDEFAGFTVLAIDCLLIETLMQFKNGVRETPFQKQQDYFLDCLRSRHFGFSNDDAVLFYKHFRNGILHQAEIKGTSKVKRGQAKLVTRTEDKQGLIINRDLFHNCLLCFFNDYKTRLEDSGNIELRNNFRVKMDMICGKAYYFAYGSNMDMTTMKDYAPSAECIARAKLPRYKLMFNKISEDGSGKANIIVCDNEEVWGAVYSVNPDEMPNLDRKEKGYSSIAREVILDTELPILVTTYYSNKIDNSLKPNYEYKQKVIDGAKQCQLPDNYIRRLQQIETTD